MSKEQILRKGRAHRALFDEDLPFRPKVVQLKNTYKRKIKHKNRFALEA